MPEVQFPKYEGPCHILCRQTFYSGTVGGGKVEQFCFKHSQKLLEENDAHDFQTWNLQKDIGMTCGEVSFYFEVHSPQSKWHITVLERDMSHKNYAKHYLVLIVRSFVSTTVKNGLINFLRFKKIHTEKPCDVLTRIPKHSFIVCIGKGHAFDKPILEACLKDFNFPYLGVIGSISKRNVLLKELMESGVDAERANNLFVPWAKILVITNQQK